MYTFLIANLLFKAVLSDIAKVCAYAQEICSTYGLIDDGILLAAGNIEKLRELVFSGLTVQVRADHFPTELAFRKTMDDLWEIDVPSEKEIPQLVKNIVDAGGNVYSVSSRRLSLEEIYFSLLKRRKAGKEA